MGLRKLGIREFLKRNFDFLSGVLLEFFTALSVLLLLALLCSLVVILSSP